MHEQQLFRELRQSLEAVGERERAARIVRVRVWVGALSHLSAARLTREWPSIVAGTLAERSTLEVEVSDDPVDPRARSVVVRSVDL